MRNNPFNRLLRAAATEHGDSSGGAAVAAAAEPTPAASPAAPGAGVPPAAPSPGTDASPAAKEPSLLDKVQASIRGKAEILSESNGLKGQVVTLTALNTEKDATIAALTAQVGTLTTQLSAKTEELTAIATALKTTEAQVVSVDEAAARQLAKHGFDQENLPAAESEPESVEGLMAQMNATTDEKKKFALAEKINALEAAPSAV